MVVFMYGTAIEYNGVQLCFLMEYTQLVLLLCFSVTQDCQSASSITLASTSGMTSKLCSIRHIAALPVRLLIFTSKDY